MRRRDFVKLIGGAAATCPLVARAQQPTTPVIGYLGFTSAKADAYLLAPFRDALNDAGFTEGRNAIIEYRFAERDVGRLPALAAELVGRNVTVIFTGTTVSALLFQWR